MVRLCLVLLLAVLMTGCRQPGDALGTTIRFDARGDRVAATPASQRATALTLPADFPRDVHLPARYAIDTLTDMPGTQIISLLAEGEGGSTVAGHPPRDGA